MPSPARGQSLSCQTIVQKYTRLSLVIGNALLLLIILNVLLYVYFAVTEKEVGRPPVSSFDPYSFRLIAKNRDTEVAEHLDVKRRSVRKLDRSRWTETVKDFAHFFLEPTIYLPYLGHGEPPYEGTSIVVRSDPYGFSYRTDSAALGMTEATRTRFKEFVDILVFGGSTVFGYHLPTEWTLPFYLERFVQKKMDAKGDRRIARVTNLGNLDYSWNENLLLFQRIIHSDLKPDAVVFLEGAHVFNAMGTTRAHHYNSMRAVWEKAQYGMIREPYTQKIPVLKWVEKIRTKIVSEKLSKLIQSRYRDSTDNPNWERLLGELTETIKVRAATAKKFGIKPYFYWQPHALVGCNQNKENHETQSAYERRTVELYKRVNNLPNKKFTFLGRPCLTPKKRGWPTFVDGFHYSPDLNRYLAEKIANQIEIG